MKLAYTKFKHLPLYLEWAPSDAFSTEAPKKKEKKMDANGEAGMQGYYFLIMSYMNGDIHVANSHK